jgi:HSP20 family protein
MAGDHGRLAQASRQQSGRLAGLLCAHQIEAREAIRLSWQPRRKLLFTHCERRFAMANTPAPPARQASPAPMGSQDPWSSFRTEMDRLFDRFAGFGMPSFRQMFGSPFLNGSEGNAAIASPAIDITEDDKAYRVTAELPGMNEKDIEVVISGDRLTLRGEKQQERQDTNKHLSERSYGMFQRSFTLPEAIDREKIEAGFHNGVLTLTLPKTAQAAQQSRKIEVKPA